LPGGVVGGGSFPPGSAKRGVVDTARTPDRRAILRILFMG
jgi:hypothetical protein